MTYNHNSTLPEELVEQIAEQGFDYLPELIRIMINAAMQAERQKHLGVGPYERSQERRDYANGYKPKTMKTRMGEITFDVPQVREGDFYPQALEKGLRSEQFAEKRLTNMVFLGVLLTNPLMLLLEAVEAGLKAHLSACHQRFLSANFAALRKGVELIAGLVK